MDQKKCKVCHTVKKNMAKEGACFDCLHKYAPDVETIRKAQLLNQMGVRVHFERRGSDIFEDIRAKNNLPDNINVVKMYNNTVISGWEN